jgi:hypothetical protein
MRRKIAESVSNKPSFANNGIANASALIERSVVDSSRSSSTTLANSQHTDLRQNSDAASKTNQPNFKKGQKKTAERGGAGNPFDCSSGDTHAAAYVLCPCSNPAGSNC